ncbi:MAG: ABC transporter ATP-binding protein [Candidatus Kapabacteria bacterium]|nr:ABC transporter ATP-binding protein [Candidatus Kapabacteria bacterium]
MSTKSIIQASHVTKTFTEPVEFKVLNDISLDVERGEFVVLVGPSGSGKTTLMYTLSTLDTVYDGSITIDGVDIKSLTKNALADFRNSMIGFVFQFHYLLPDFTVLQNVMLPAQRKGGLTQDEMEDRAMKTLALLGVADQAMKRSSKLSGGQQQRVAIARALINDPKIIFGDEPTGNLDTKNTSMVLDILNDLKTEYHQTILMVTHDVEFAKRADRVISIRDGRIVDTEEHYSPIPAVRP